MQGWIDYEALEPFGSRLSDIYVGLIVQALYQHTREKSVGSLDKFIPKWAVEEKEPLTPEQYKRKAMRAYLGNGGQLK